MKKTLGAIIFVSMFFFIVFPVSVLAWGTWNSGGAATMNNMNYNYNYNSYTPAVNYGYDSYYQTPVVNYGYNNWNTWGGYSQPLYGNTWNQGFGVGVNAGWNTGGFMPVGYGGGFGNTWGGGYGNTWNNGWNTWGGGCQWSCYGSPVFY